MSGRRAEHDLFLDWVVSGNAPAAQRKDILGKTTFPSDPCVKKFHFSLCMTEFTKSYTVYALQKRKNAKFGP